MELSELGFGASVLDQVRESTFDPIEANFLSTVLKDCYDQLHNVGENSENKIIKLPQLINIEKRARVRSMVVQASKNTSQYYSTSEYVGTAASTTSRLTQAFSSVYRKKEVHKLSNYSNLDDNATWMERLVEAHGYLEDTYIKTVDKARSILEAKKDSHERIVVNLEQQGIRMKTFELSRAVADRENALNLMNSTRTKNILDGLKKIILSTSEELKNEGTYEILKQRNKTETNAIAKGPNLINQELQLHELCNTLIESIIEEKKRGQHMIKEREAQVASLKDYLKEQKVLRNLEITYIKKFSEASLEQAKLANDKQFEELQNSEELILQQIKDDVKTNEVMESFLNKEITEKQELLKWWMEKYDIEIERKSIELKEIKDQLEKDQEWYELLKKRIVEFEEVIEDDKRIKAIAQSRIDLEKLQERKALQIQKWWRGLRVRRCMGPFKKKKKKKSKEPKGGDEKDKKK